MDKFAILDARKIIQPNKFLGLHTSILLGRREYGCLDKRRQGVGTNVEKNITNRGDKRRTKVEIKKICISPMT